MSPLNEPIVDVSILIVAWNVREFLKNCLSSVYSETLGISYEVIYVDNASEDSSIEMVEGMFPQTKIIRNSENRGFIKANNQAIEIAKGRYVLLLNSDTIVLDNAIAKTVEFADKHTKAAVVGCKILNPDRSLQRCCHTFNSKTNMFLQATYLYKLFPRSKYFGRKEMSWFDFNSECEVDVVAGCFSLVRSEAIRQIGHMDEDFFVYCDDFDWCYRFKSAGWKVMFTPSAQIIHYGGQTTKKAANDFVLQLYGSGLLFVKKHRTPLDFIIVRFLTAAFFWIRFCYWFIIGIFRRQEREMAFKSAAKYLRGGYYCLTDWRKLVMNYDVIAQKYHG